MSCFTYSLGIYGHTKLVQLTTFTAVDSDIGTCGKLGLSNSKGTSPCSSEQLEVIDVDFMLHSTCSGRLGACPCYVRFIWGLQRVIYNPDSRRFLRHVFIGSSTLGRTGQTFREDLRCGRRRRAFWKRNSEPEQPSRLRITANCENSWCQWCISDREYGGRCDINIDFEWCAVVSNCFLRVPCYVWLGSLPITNIILILF